MALATAISSDDRLRVTRDGPELVQVPDLTCLMCDGHGEPGSPAFQRSAEALFTLSYTMAFALKRATGHMHPVGPLERLWWADGGTAFTLLIAQPGEVTPALYDDARARALHTRGLWLAGDVRLERFEEGLAAQVLHVGPYSAQNPTIELLHAFIRDNGLSFDSRVQRQHEIYLGDARRTAPERLRTILRQPVVRP